MRVAGTRAEALRHAGEGELAESKRRFLDASNADRRGGRHSTGVRWWVVFCVYGRGVSPILDPRRLTASYDYRVAAEDLLEDYAVWLAEYRPSGRQVSHKSILKYVSSVRGWFRRFYRAELGLGAAASRIPALMRGYARLVDQPPPRERHGCDPAALALGMQRECGDGTAVSDMWCAAMSTAFCLLARGCEIALDEGEPPDPTQHLVPADVTLFERGGVRHARLQMRKRKDMKVLRGKHATVVLAGGGELFDTVRLLERWLRVRAGLGIDSQAPLFCWPDGRGVTVAELRAMVKRVMAAAGLDPALFGAHSLRIGGATAALAAGVPPALIRLMGRWSSDIYEIYTRMSLEAALKVGRAIASTRVTSFEGGFREERLELQPAEVAMLRRCAGVPEGVQEEEGEDG